MSVNSNTAERDYNETRTASWKAAATSNESITSADARACRDRSAAHEKTLNDSNSTHEFRDAIAARTNYENARLAVTRLDVHTSDRERTETLKLQQAAAEKQDHFFSICPNEEYGNRSAFPANTDAAHAQLNLANTQVSGTGRTRAFNSMLATEQARSLYLK